MATNIPVIWATLASCFLTLVAAADTKSGVELYKAGKYAEAAAELGQVVRNEPADIQARYYLGLSLLQQGQNKEAESHFAAAQEQLTSASSPTLDEVNVGLARAQMDQKKYDQAEASLEGAFEVNPRNPEIFVYRGKLQLLRNNPAAAVEQLQNAIEMDPKNAYAHYYAGMAYSKTGRPDRMVAEFQTFLKLAPNAPEAAKVRSLLRGIR